MISPLPEVSVEKKLKISPVWLVEKGAWTIRGGGRVDALGELLPVELQELPKQEVQQGGKDFYGDEELVLGRAGQLRDPLRVRRLRQQARRQDKLSS